MESDYFTRQTFRKLMASFPVLNFANVCADAIYLMPGSEKGGFPKENLFSGGYEYLKR